MKQGHKTHNTKIQNPRINNQIKTPELLVVDDEGNNLGVISLEDGLKAAEEKGLDLIEIAPQASPPVARIMSFDKFRYQQSKEEKKQKKKAPEMKEVRISARAAKNDLLIKVKLVEKFLEGGHKVKINLRLRGRERANRDWARKKLNEFLELITVEHKILLPPKAGGQGFIVQISK